MPMKLLNNLDRRSGELSDFRHRISENDVLALDRAEAAWRAFSRVREMIGSDTPLLYETNGLAAGLALCGPIVRGVQDATRDAVGRDDLDSELGRARIEALAEVAKAVTAAVESRRRESATLAGRVDGLYRAAGLHLDDLRGIIEKHLRDARRTEGDDDWSGRGTANGQRPPADNVVKETNDGADAG